MAVELAGHRLRWAWLVAPALFCAALALRLPFVTHYLWSWDSVLYARAIASFDVARMQPHAPGYLFYVLLADAANAVIGDVNGALVLVSAVAGAATVAVAYLVGTHLGRRVGVLAALVLATSPLLWSYSEVAYPYTVLAVLAGGLGGLLCLWPRSTRVVLAASLLLGLTAGFRQDVLVILGPLWLWTALAHGRRTATAALALLGAGCVVWFVPTALLSEGVATYLATLRDQAASVSPLGSEGTTVLENAQRVGTGIAAQLALALLLVPAGLWALAHRRRGLAVPLALWTLPALAFYVLVHIGEFAYTLSLAVPLALVAALGADELLRVAPPRRVVAGALAVALALDLGWFLVGTGPYSAAATRERDLALERELQTIRQSFAPTDTIIVARHTYQQVRFYLPEYRVVYARQRERWRALPVRGKTRRVVLFGGELGARPEGSVRTISGAGGLRVRFVQVDAETHYAVTGDEVVAEQ